MPNKQYTPEEVEQIKKEVQDTTTFRTKLAMFMENTEARLTSIEGGFVDCQKACGKRIVIGCGITLVISMSIYSGVVNADTIIELVGKVLKVTF